MLNDISREISFLSKFSYVICCIQDSSYLISKSKKKLYSTNFEKKKEHPKEFTQLAILSHGPFFQKSPQV